MQSSKISKVANGSADNRHSLFICGIGIVLGYTSNESAVASSSQGMISPETSFLPIEGLEIINARRAYMRARQHRVVFYLNDKELENLNRKAGKTKLPREAYLRKAISGAVLIEAPPIEYYELLREVKKSGSQLDRLLKLAESGTVPEAAEIRKALDCNTTAELLLWDAFAPKK